jgi:hypothetical protein
MSLNSWAQFDKLFDKRKMRLGTVTSHDSTVGESVLTEPGGAVFRAIGTTVAIGNMAFVIDGKVDRQAPALSTAIEYI